MEPAAPLAEPALAPATLPAESPALPSAVTPPVAPPSSTSPAWSPVFTGSYFARYELRSNYDAMGVSRGRFLEGDATFFRLRFGVGTGLFDIGNGLKVGLQFTPQAAGVLGALGPNTVADAVLGLHEGYARVQGALVRLDAGRFELNYGEALVLGNLDWNELGRSFDGLRARLAKDPAGSYLDLFATVIDEGRDPALATSAPRTLGIGDGDVYFLGAYAGLGPALTKGLELDVYAFLQNYHEQRGLKLVPADATSASYRREGANQVTLGARVKQRLGALDYRAEGGLQFGSRQGAVPVAMPAAPPVTVQRSVDARAFQIDAELGMNMIEDKLRVGVEGIYASGDDPDTQRNEGWDELYPTAHKFLGLADVLHQRGVKRTNVTSGVLHLTVKPTAKLAVQADGHYFARPQKVNGVTGRAGAEVDVGAAYTLAKGLKVRALYALFLPDKDFYPMPSAVGPIDPIHYAEVELRYDLAP